MAKPLRLFFVIKKNIQYDLIVSDIQKSVTD